MTTAPERPDTSPLPRATASPGPARAGSTKALIGVLLSGIAILVVVGFVHFSQDGHIRAGTAPAHAECTKGGADCLPDVNYVDTTGVAYTRASLAGKVVLVNFWATWCHPCQSEIPDLSKAYEKYKGKDVVFLGVMTDTPDSQQLLNFQSDFEMTYPVVRANSDLMVSYNYPDQLPTTLVFDRSGKQVYRHIGGLRERDLDSLLSQLVAQKL